MLRNGFWNCPGQADTIGVLSRKEKFSVSSNVVGDVVGPLTGDG